MKWKIYHALKADPYITTHVLNEIKFYEYPPTDHMDGIYLWSILWMFRAQATMPITNP